MGWNWDKTLVLGVRVRLILEIRSSRIRTFIEVASAGFAYETMRQVPKEQDFGKRIKAPKFAYFILLQFRTKDEIVFGA